MGQQKRSGGARLSLADQAARDQEVLRANRELAAYFKGRRTEREARAALKTLKAFVRERERLEAKNRPPLPLVSKPAASAETQRRPSRGKSHGDSVRDTAPSIEPGMSADTEVPTSSRH